MFKYNKENITKCREIEWQGYWTMFRETTQVSGDRVTDARQGPRRQLRHWDKSRHTRRILDI